MFSRATTHTHCQQPHRPAERCRRNTTKRTLPTFAQHTEFGNPRSPGKHSPNWQGHRRKGREPGRGGDRPQSRIERSRHAKWPSTIQLLQMSSKARRKTSMRLLAERTESLHAGLTDVRTLQDPNDHCRQSCSETEEPTITAGRGVQGMTPIRL